MEKLNPLFIIKDHLNTLRNEKKNKLSKEDFFVFFGIPLISSLILIYFGWILDVELCKVFLTILAISVPLLLNLLILMFDIRQNVENNEKNNYKMKMLKLKYIRETSSNISFTVLVSILVIGLSTLFVFGKIFNEIIIILISFIIYLLLGIIILTILMILKRAYILINPEIVED